MSSVMHIVLKHVVAMNVINLMFSHEINVPYIHFSYFMLSGITVGCAALLAILPTIIILINVIIVG